MMSKKKKIVAGAGAAVIILAGAAFFLGSRGSAGTGGHGGPGGMGSPGGMQQESNVTVVNAANPTTGDVSVTSSLTGTVEAADVVYVYAKAGGDVTAVNVKAGDIVSQGQVLMEINTEQVESAKNNMDSAQVNLSQAQSNLNRMQILYGSGDLSDQEYEQYQNNLKSAELQYESAKLAYEKQVEYSTVTAPISGKIGRGATLARQELAADGIKIRLETVNTEAPDWLAKLSALPPACAVVGGPLQARNYAQARSTGAVDQRAFFTFLPSLEQGDEGARAWRFFPSPQDQIDALIAFATDGLNIRTYGAFYPSDAYGARMTGMLEQSLAGRNMLLYKAAYDPADVSSWSTAVAPLINATQAEGSGTPVPQTAFEALFLPDSWKSMDMLTTSLLYNGEDRLVLLGTTLWEQSLSGKMVPNAEKYALAVFPGAWNAARAPRPASAGQ